MDKLTKLTIKVILYGLFNVAVYFAWMIGSVLAVVVSWEANHSIAFALLHGLLGWVYVFYNFHLIFLCAFFTSTILMGVYFRFNSLRDKYKKAQLMNSSFETILKSLELEKDLFTPKGQDDEKRK